ncbi:MAG: hypothetical protein ABJO27_01180 [Pseudoruegeria sp.]
MLSKERHQTATGPVPGEELSNRERIEQLVSEVHRLCPQDMDRLYLKLEYIGDRRLRDNGAVPYRGWMPERIGLKTDHKSAQKEDFRTRPSPLRLICKGRT